jgi:predicted nucleic acid-binding protein
LPGSLVYLDASALVKLVAVEPESSALAEFLGDWESRVTSRISTVEVIRATRREAMPALVERAGVLLASVSFVEVSREIARLAGLLDPPTLRGPDAIHVASALSLSTDAGPFLTYEARMQEAATIASLDVRAPA